MTTSARNPLERLLRDQGGAIEFVPADFRRFAPTLERIRPRGMATAAAPPDQDGWCSPATNLMWW